MENLIKKLGCAWNAAEEGDVYTMEYLLDDVSVYAKRMGLDVSAQTGKIEETGYNIGLSLKLAESEIYAGKRDFLLMNIFIGDAEKCAKKLKMDVCEQVESIRKLSLADI